MPSTTGRRTNRPPDRYSRLCADTVALARDPRAASAIERLDVLERVVGWKRRFFRSRWGRYDTAKPGTLGLVPPEARIPNLRRAYDAMREMYLSEPASFDTAIESPAAVERRGNTRRDAGSAIGRINSSGVNKQAARFSAAFKDSRYSLFRQPATSLS